MSQENPTTTKRWLAERTWNEPNQRIDYVLVPHDAIVTATHTPAGGDAWRDLSDHLPVLVEFRC